MTTVQNQQTQQYNNQYNNQSNSTNSNHNQQQVQVNVQVGQTGQVNVSVSEPANAPPVNVNVNVNAAPPSGIQVPNNEPSGSTPTASTIAQAITSLVSGNAAPFENLLSTLSANNGSVNNNNTTNNNTTNNNSNYTTTNNNTGSTGNTNTSNTGNTNTGNSNTGSTNYNSTGNNYTGSTNYNSTGSTNTGSTNYNNTGNTNNNTGTTTNNNTGSISTGSTNYNNTGNTTNNTGSTTNNNTGNTTNNNTGNTTTQTTNTSQSIPSTYGGTGAGSSVSSLAGTGAAGSVTGATQTKDGYTVTQCKADMAKLASTQGGSVPAEPLYTQVAQGIIDGINNNFSGQNLIGDFSNVSGKQMAASLISSAWQESRFGVGGTQPGGVFQCAQGRLDQYNQHNGTNLSMSQLTNDPSLSIKVGLWAMANPYTIVGVPASASNPIPSSLPEQALYYWNYNPNNDEFNHGNQLTNYVSNTEQFASVLGSTVS